LLSEPQHKVPASAEALQTSRHQLGAREPRGVVRQSLAVDALNDGVVGRDASGEVGQLLDERRLDHGKFGRQRVALRDGGVVGGAAASLLFLAGALRATGTTPHR